MNTVTANLADLRNEIAPCKPVIIAVTKYFGAEKLVEAYEAGLRNFAENRVADALEKFGNLPEEIKQNSIYEVEIRANMLMVIDLIKRKLNDRVCAIDINDYIWGQGKNKSINLKPYHLTRTTNY